MNLSTKQPINSFDVTFLSVFQQIIFLVKKLCIFLITHFVFSSCLVKPIFAREFRNQKISDQFEVHSSPEDSVFIRNRNKVDFKIIKNKISIQNNQILLTNKDKNRRINFKYFVQKMGEITQHLFLDTEYFLTNVIKKSSTYFSKRVFHANAVIKNYFPNTQSDRGFLVAEIATMTPESDVLGVFESNTFDLPEFLHQSKGDTNDGCIGEHNAEKKYSISSAAKLLSGMLKKGPNGLFNQFKCDDPYSLYIPEKARAIYKKSITWLPQRGLISRKVTNDYLQCITFVFMSYELAGHPIQKKGRSNADDLLADKYSGKNGQFTKFESGKTTVLPQEGDVIVWSAKSLKNSYGHVGIVIEVRPDEFLTRLRARQAGKVSHPDKTFGIIRIANSNSDQVLHEYQYVIDEKTKVVSLEKVKKDWAKVPDFWLRMK